MDKQSLLDQINALSENTLLSLLDIQFVDVGDDFLVATMPVNPSVHQPAGILHGGASVVLGETVASTLSNVVLFGTGAHAVGYDITAHHLRPMKDGMVTCKAILKRQGRKLHYTEMEITDEQGRLVCALNMTNMVIEGQE